MYFNKIGIVIADDMEFAPFKKSAEKFKMTEGNLNSYDTIKFNIGEKEIFAVKCRIGKVNAATATAMMIMKENPDCVLNIGLSGGVKGVNRGTVFAGTSFTECDFDLTPLGYEIGIKPDQDNVYSANEELLAKVPQGVYKFKCGTGDYFLTKQSQKDEYYKLFGINTFDMETGAIASVCHSCSVPFLCVRKVSDDSEDSAAEDYKKMNNLAETALSDILFDIIEKL